MSIPKACALLYLFLIAPSLQYFISISKIKPLIFSLLLFWLLLTVVNIFNMRNVTLDFLNPQIFQHIILFWIITNHGILRPRVIEKGMLIIATGTIFLSLSYYFGIGVEVSSTELFNQGRVRVFGDNENMIGIRICTALIILFITLYSNKLNIKWERYLYLLFFPILFYLIFFVFLHR